VLAFLSAFNVVNSCADQLFKSGVSMRKNILALSIAAMIGGLGLAGGASANIISAATGSNTESLPTAADAVVLAPSTDGIGHILIVPYFTVQNGNSTLINLVNTDSVYGKAVKIRFRGASNSDDVYDFQIFLSPSDVWTANISVGSDGRARLTTTDNSCTLPSVVNASFVTDRLPASYSATEKAAETREGYIEILNMADIPQGRYTLAQAGLNTDDSNNPLFTAIKHVSGVAPCTSATLARLVTDPTVHNDSTAANNAARQGLALPSGGLFANWTIVNVPGAASWTGAATAIVAYDTNVFTANDTGYGNLVFHPQTNAPASAPETRTADPLLAGGSETIDSLGAPGDAVPAPIAASMFDFPDLSTPYTITSNPLQQAFLVTQAIAVSSVNNEYLTDPTIFAQTDWVFSSPTRRYSVGLDYTTDPFSRVFADLGGAGETYFYTGNTSIVDDTICVAVSDPTYYDREENTGAPDGFVISPGAQQDLTFCGEVSVLTFNNAGGTSVLGAELTRVDIDVGFQDGWMTIGTPGNETSSIGLPVLGNSFMSALNPAVSAGVAGNFGLTFPHRFTRPTGIF
jgi:hypothetical protein